MSEQVQGPAAGWYPDQNMPGTQRYWDGSKWTEHVAPLETRKGPAPVNNDGTLVFGIITAIVFPIIGLICGFVLVGRGDQRGLIAVVLSMIFFVVWYFVFQNQFSGGY
jgi:hypothetical protein